MISRRAVVVVVVGAAVVLGVAACSSGPTSDRAARSGSSTAPGPTTAAATAAPSSGAGALPTPDHVMVVIFENEGVERVMGAADAPYLTSLGQAGATFTDAHGETHPSQPNYLALFSGSTQGVTSDACPQSFSEPNLAAQLIAAGHSFTGYSEDLPQTGFTGCGAGLYARKHNPWVNFAALPGSVNQPYSAFPNDFSALPTVSFVVPNLCNDMHNCGVAAGDRWARANLARYVEWARTHKSLLVVTFDEDNGTADNHIATLLVGPMVRPGPSGQRIDHYSLLRTIEDMYGLSHLGQAATAQPITGIWTG